MADEVRLVGIAPLLDSDRLGGYVENAISEQRSPAQQQPRQRNWRLPLLFIVLAALAVLFTLTGRQVWHYFRSPEELRVLVASWGVWAPLGIILLQAIQILVAPLPGSLMSFVAGYAFGVWPAIVWLMLGVLLGATLDFLLARILGRRLLRYLVPEDRLERLDSVIIRRGSFYIFLLLLIPNPLGDWIYYLAGLTPLPLPVFLGFVFIARLPSNLVEAILGSSATRFNWLGWLIMGVVVIGLSIAYYLNQRRIETFVERLASRRQRPA
ncbi:MAG: VTT domain-containing protein [candidate division WOR-3 bacterium]